MVTTALFRNISCLFSLCLVVSAPSLYAGDKIPSGRPLPDQSVFDGSTGPMSFSTDHSSGAPPATPRVKETKSMDSFSPPRAGTAAREHFSPAHQYILSPEEQLGEASRQYKEFLGNPDWAITPNDLFVRICATQSDTALRDGETGYQAALIQAYIAFIKTQPQTPDVTQANAFATNLLSKIEPPHTPALTHFT